MFRAIYVMVVPDRLWCEDYWPGQPLTGITPLR